MYFYWVINPLIASMLYKDLMAASSIPMILTIIKKEETYGYEIIQSIRSISDGNIEWQEGSLYPILKKLEKKELVRSRWSQTMSGKKRKYYSITMKGTNELRIYKSQWMLANEVMNDLWTSKMSV